MIRLGILEESEKIFSLYQACRKEMERQGFFNWHDDYPNLQTIEKDIREKTIFVFELEQHIAGVITLNETEDPEYKKIKWLTPKERSLIVHRLAVHPNFQGKGLASKLMDFAEEKARAENYLSVRLDAYSINERLLNFYIKRNYIQLGEVFFEMPESFICFEWVLK